MKSAKNYLQQTIEQKKGGNINVDDKTKKAIKNLTGIKQLLYVNDAIEANNNLEDSFAIRQFSFEEKILFAFLRRWRKEVFFATSCHPNQKLNWISDSFWAKDPASFLSFLDQNKIRIELYNSQSVEISLSDRDINNFRCLEQNFISLIDSFYENVKYWHPWFFDESAVTSDREE